MLYAVWMFSIFSFSQVYIIINNIIALWLHIFSKLVKFGCLQMYSTQSDVGASPTYRQLPEAGSVNARTKTATLHKFNVSNCKKVFRLADDLNLEDAPHVSVW